MEVGRTGMAGVGRIATKIGVACTLVLLLAAGSARAAGSDAFSGATFLHFGKADQTNLAPLTTEPGEMLTDKGTGWCGEQRYLTNTAWYTFVGNGRAVSVGTSGPVQMIISVFRGEPFGADIAGRVVDCRYAPSTSTVGWNTVDGQRYWIQVGVCADARVNPSVYCSWPGGATPTALVLAQSAPPPYDTRANAAQLQPGALYDNHGAGQEAEINACNGAEYGNTVWLRWTAPTWGTAVFNLGGMAGVVSIRRPGTDAVSACGAGAAETKVAKGEELFLQVGGDRQLIGYNEGHFSLGATIRDPDDDNDGVPNDGDCRPADPSINPGKPEIKDDGIDQNCRPGDDRALKPPTSGAFTVAGGKLRKFALNDALKGSRISVTCRGRACKRRAIVVSRGLKRDVKRLKLPRRIVGPLRRGTRLRVDVLNRPDWLGRRFQWRMTSGSTWVFSGRCQRGKSKWKAC